MSQMHPNPLTQPHTQVAPAGELLWLGLYHNETRLGLARGWERCVSADAPTIFNWFSDPTDLYGAPVFCRVPSELLYTTGAQSYSIPVCTPGTGLRQRPKMHMHMHPAMCGLCMYYYLQR